MFKVSDKTIITPLTLPVAPIGILQILLLLQFQRQNKIDASIGFRMTWSVQMYPICSFIFEKKVYTFVEHCINFSLKKCKFMNLFFLKNITEYVIWEYFSILNTFLFKMNWVPSLQVQNYGRSRLLSAGNFTFQEGGFCNTYDRNINKQKEPKHQEPIEGIKVWISK